MRTATINSGESGVARCPAGSKVQFAKAMWGNGKCKQNVLSQVQDSCGQGRKRSLQQLDLPQGGCIFDGGLSVVSANQQFRATLQGDGNFVLYNPAGPLWHSHTNGQGVGPYRLCLQDDANLVLTDARNVVLWHTRTHGKGVPPFRLVTQDDAHLVLYDSQGTPLWFSRTNGNVANMNSALSKSGQVPTFSVESECEVVASPDIFGDRCPGQNKLFYAWSCVADDEAVTQTVVKGGWSKEFSPLAVGIILVLSIAIVVVVIAAVFIRRTN
jgi:hypothetical protein